MEKYEARKLGKAQLMEDIQYYMTVVLYFMVTKVVLFVEFDPSEGTFYQHFK